MVAAPLRTSRGDCLGRLHFVAPTVPLPSGRVNLRAAAYRNAR